MDRRVKKRLIGALVLLGLVVIFVPVIFHIGNIKTDSISMSPDAPEPPAKLAVINTVHQQAEQLAIKQQSLLKHAPAQPNSTDTKS